MDGQIDYEKQACRPQDFVSCPFCKVTFAQRDIILHVNSGCPEQLVECSFCDCRFPRNRLQEHQRCCDMRPAKCEHCHASFETYFQLRERHYTSCPHKPQSCAYEVFGCKFQGTKEDLRKHDMQNMHAELLRRRLEHTEGELKAVKKRAGADTRSLTEKIDQLSAKNLLLEESNEELLKQVQDQAGALQDLKNKLENFLRDHQTQENKTQGVISQCQRSVDYMIRERDLITPEFTYTWKIQPYRHLKQTTTQLDKALRTDVISTGSPGYRFRFSCSFAAHNLGVYMMIHSGVDDDLLPWPFANRIIVRLKSQKNPQDDVEKVIQPARDKSIEACFQKPEDSGHNARFGFNEFIRIPVLENEMKGFLVGNCIVLQFIVLPL